MKNRGVKDILILCADALSGIKDAINAAFYSTPDKKHAKVCKRIYTAPRPDA